MSKTTNVTTVCMNFHSRLLNNAVSTGHVNKNWMVKWWWMKITQGSEMSPDLFERTTAHQLPGEAE